MAFDLKNILMTRWVQWNLFKAIWIAAAQILPSIPADFPWVFPQQQKIATTNETNK